MTPIETLQLAGAAFLWTLSGFFAFFILVFVVIFISDGVKAWRRKRRLIKILRTAKPIVLGTDTYFDKITEYRNELS